MRKTNSINQLIILDRDGVINLDSDDYIKSPEEWIPIKSSLRAIAKLNRAGYWVAIATNQSGIARGYFDPMTLALMHKKMELELAQMGGHIDAIEYCPDHPENPTHCRKPNPGMLEKLLEQFSVEAAETWFVGDSSSDLECAINAHCKPALVLTGKGQKTLSRGNLPEQVSCFKDLDEFVEKLLAH
ncbi:MAG: D-glycero-beta-D-manno-heptose 1,7-bisphosphate 7-phosphatase [Kangiellaceae bacterium]|jgi:D-glycero-D-manno-heptose 1,7-bisphosphate phosphatase